MRRSMTIDEIDAAIERWQRRLFRAARAMEQLAKARKRVVAKMSYLVSKENTSSRCTVAEAAKTLETVEVEPEPADDLSIPAQFLRPKTNAADEKAKAEILTQQEAAKKEKTTARIAKLKADKAGERKRMPLQGKDAMKAIMGQGEK